MSDRKLEGSPQNFEQNNLKKYKHLSYEILSTKLFRTLFAGFIYIHEISNNT
jgi:hypothetical protein